MPQCKKCDTVFPNRIKIDGMVKNMQQRKYCLSCSPFGKHNTSKIHIPVGCTTCGDTDTKNFYHKKTQCKKCFNEEMVTKQKEARSYALNLLGNKCSCCGFDKYLCSLDIHHTDPSMKDKNFASLRSWLPKRIEKELETCILLCRNCHQALHSGYDIWN